MITCDGMLYGVRDAFAERRKRQISRLDGANPPPSHCTQVVPSARGNTSGERIDPVASAHPKNNASAGATGVGGLAHRLHRFDIAVTSEFQFKQRPGAVGGCQVSYLFRRIESVARRPRWHRALRCVTVERREDRPFHRLKFGHDAVNALAVSMKRHPSPQPRESPSKISATMTLTVVWTPCTVANGCASRPVAPVDCQSLRMGAT
jgi:hypothetical protein